MWQWLGALWDWLATTKENFIWVVAAMIGRAMFHAREAQEGRRRFWGKELPFELLLAIGMGLVGYSTCAWLELDGPVAAGVISAISYLGPRAIDTLFDRFSTTAANLFASKPKAD